MAEIHSDNFESYAHNQELPAPFTNQTWVNFRASNVNPKEGTLGMECINTASPAIGRWNRTVPNTPAFFQMWIRSPNAATKNFLPVMCHSTQIYNASRLGPYYGFIGTGGKMYLAAWYGGKWNYIYEVALNTYYLIKVILSGSNTYDVYLDGVKRIENAAYYNAQTSIDAIHFHSGTANSGGYVDELLIDDGVAGAAKFRFDGETFGASGAKFRFDGEVFT